MATLAGIINQHSTAAEALTNKSATPTAESTSSSTSAATISANDFLTLLVTELQNQDPTASTDPNEYVNQLVSVNSLEQLIDINQTLTSATSSTSTTSSTTKAKNSTTQIQSGTGLGAQNAAQSSIASRATSGNLSVPESTLASQRVSNALNGRHKAS
jgi:flagellar basal-body rod modification protein FlgD